MIIDSENNIGSNKYVLIDRWEQMEALPRVAKSTLQIQLLIDSGSIVEGSLEVMLKHYVDDEWWHKKLVAWRVRERPKKVYEIEVGEVNNCFIVYLFDRIKKERVPLANYINDEADAQHIARLYSKQWKVDYYG